MDSIDEASAAKLRKAIGKLAVIAGSESVCGQAPINIDTYHVQMQVAKGTIIPFFFVVICC